MEHTNDVIFKVHYKKDNLDANTYGRHRKLRRLLRRIEDDQYFTLVLITSAIALTIDFMILKKFIEIVNLL